MSNRTKTVLLIVVAVSIGAYLGWWFKEQRGIDACLDAGGRWEKQGGYCIYAVFRSPE